MNPLFPNAKKIIVPSVMKFPFEMGDDEWHPIDERNHYQEILIKILGEEKGIESAIVDITFDGNFIILEII